MSIKQKIINKEITYKEACTDYYNDLTKEDVDFILEKKPWYVAQFLNQHPFFTQKHFDYIVKKVPNWAAEYLNQHPFFTKECVDYIVEKETKLAVEYLKHKLSNKNIEFIGHNYPDILKELFK